ncbi:MAG TPA: peptidoglycan-binding domain-containing protein [Acidimicrobiales bacterium]|nr:peptidoglycan-binding domain-containing protein [Acidimicrobiales bacterium]
MKRVLAVLAALAVAGGGWAAFQAGSDGADAEEPAVRTGTATVSRKTLVQREEVDGTIGFGDATAVVGQRQGTLTRLAGEGDVVERGKPLYWVDEVPVVLLYGDVPAYRRMAAGSDDGADVKQLEENLKALGHNPGTVDGEWTSATTAAVKRWEKALGVAENGVVEAGDVVFRPGALRVAEHVAGVGGPASGEVFKATAATRLVAVDLDATKQTMVKVGDAVEVELPDGRTVAGRITTVGKVATVPQGDQQQRATVKLTVSLDDPGDYDQAPVDVRLTQASKENVLAVPVAALLALAEGGYAVETTDGRLVAVETGLFADGWVEVTGDVAEGLRVVVPA